MLFIYMLKIATKSYKIIEDKANIKHMQRNIYLEIEIMIELLKIMESRWIVGERQIYDYSWF